jgi:hypothetical protein
MSDETTDPDDLGLSEQLVELVFAAFDQGMKSIQEGEPLVPFVITQDASDATLNRFGGGSHEEALDDARDFVTGQPVAIRRFALTFDAYITIDGEQFDALIVHAGERGSDQGVVFAQRYEPATKNKTVSSIGGPAYLGEAEQLLGRALPV